MAFPLIAALVGGVAGIAQSAITGSATKKATKAAERATAENNALARETRDLVNNTIQPFMPGAYAANTELQRLLGGSGGNGNLLGGKSAGGFAGTSPNEQQYDIDGYIQQNPDVAAAIQQHTASGAIGPNGQWKTPQEWVSQVQLPNAKANGEQRAYPMLEAQPVDPQQAQAEGGYFGPDAGARATYTRPNFGSAPAAPDIDPSKYEASPQFGWLLNQGNRNLKAGSAAGGLGQSGAAAKEAITFGQGLAGQDYQKWVGNLFSLDSINRGQFNLDRDVGNRNFDVDSARDMAIYDADRNYDTSRFDARVGNLFQLSGQGLGAAGTLAGNANQYYGNVSANNNNMASITGNAAISGANNASNLLGQGLQGLGYLYGAGGFGSPSLPKTYSI